MAHRSLVGAHVCVDPRISVSEGHRIAEMTRKRVLDSHPTVSDVLVHVDVEDDLDHDSSSQSMPDRAELMGDLAPVLAGLPEPQRVVPVSYTHLDVYKRQVRNGARGNGRESP